MIDPEIIERLSREIADAAAKATKSTLAEPNVKSIALEITHSVPSIRAAFALIEAYIEKNATHRKGFRLQEISTLDIVKHAAGELVELGSAFTPADRLDELVDVTACLFQLASRFGYTLDDVGKAMLEKLPTRFNVPTSTSDFDLLAASDAGLEAIGESEGIWRRDEEPDVVYRERIAAWRAEREKRPAAATETGSGASETAPSLPGADTDDDTYEIPF